MNQTVHFEDIDGVHERLTITQEEAEALVLPSKGEKVGIWKLDADMTAYALHYVVEVRHYITTHPEIEQEIHVLCSDSP